MQRIAVAACLLACAFFCSFTAACADSVDEPVRAVLMKLGESLSANDADAVGQAFTDDAVFVDSFGEQTIGRANIADRFRSARTKNPSGTTVILHPDRIRQLSPDAASVIGEVSRDRSGVAVPASRFMANLVRSNGNWLIQSATETALKTTATDNLAELKWLSGKWTSGGKRLSAEFLPCKTFLQLKLQDGDSAADTCILGWDAAAKNVQSWQFNNDGGFSTSTWTKRGNDWLVDASGVSADGEKTRALGLLTPISNDEFTWSTSRISGTVFGEGNKQLTTWKRAE